MLNEPTLDKLQAMRLQGMAASWLEQNSVAATAKLAFDERFGMLVDAEWTHRDNKRLSRALKEAKLKLSAACVEDIDYPAKRELDKAVVLQLASCRWIQQHQAVLITGATGTGKTYIACALAQQACRKGFRCAYFRAGRLFDELRLAHADGSYIRLLARIARCDVLVIDDFAMAPVTDAQRHHLLEILDDRYETRSTIVTSQLDPSDWHDYLADPTLADAICDRIVHHAHRLMLKGPSRRKEKPADKK
ncbi:MAG: IS21-like element helper ATPase IstB [Polyangiaceae bacterium]|nr:IS21-like element helper ATPase IstB [Polyangiaceae bacterium]